MNLILMTRREAFKRGQWALGKWPQSGKRAHGPGIMMKLDYFSRKICISIDSSPDRLEKESEKFLLKCTIS